MRLTDSIKDLASINMYQKQRANRAVTSMITNFNRSKNSYELQNSRFMESGRLDMSRIHSHKTSDDIFKRDRVLPRGKNHGVVMLLDWSGSMRGAVQGVVRQAYTVSLFCKRMGIPFKALTFTSGEGQRAKASEENAREATIQTSDLDMNVLFSHEMSQFDILETYQLVSLAFSEIRSHTDEARFSKIYGRTHYDVANEIRRSFRLDMGGTPLAHGIIQSYIEARRLKNEFGLDKISVLAITDGGNTNALTNVSSSAAADYLIDPFNSKSYPVKQGRGGSTAFVEAANNMVRGAGIEIFNIYIGSGDATSMMRDYYSELNIPMGAKAELDKSYKRSEKVGVLQEQVAGFTKSLVVDIEACFGVENHKNKEDAPEDLTNAKEEEIVKELVRASGGDQRVTNMLGDFVVKWMTSSFRKNV